MRATLRAKRSTGFTLIEMMISVAVLAVITVYMTGLLMQQSRGYEVVDDVAETQQAERAIGDLMERDVRASGLLVAAGGVISGVDNQGAAGMPVSDVVCVTDTDAVANPEAISDAGLGIDVTGGYTGTGTNAILLSQKWLESTAAPAYDNSNPADGTLDTDFTYSLANGLRGGVIVTDPSNPQLGSQCGLVTHAASVGTLGVDWNVTVNGRQLVPAPDPLGAGAKVVIPAHIYYVEPGTATTGPALFRDGIRLADDVEDLQVAYFHDMDFDGACDSNEWSGGACPGPLPPGWNGYTASAENNCFLRAVRFNFVVRTANQDAVARQNPAAAQNAFLQTENAPARVGFDGFRRRVFSRTVIPRNSPINSGAVPRGCS